MLLVDTYSIIVVIFYIQIILSQAFIGFTIAFNIFIRRNIDRTKIEKLKSDKRLSLNN